MRIGKDLVRNLERHIKLHIACDIVKDNGGRLDFLQFSQDLGICRQAHGLGRDLGSDQRDATWQFTRKIGFDRKIVGP